MIKQSGIFILAILLANCLSAQKVKSKLSSNQIWLGNEFTLIVEIECEKTDQISYLPETKHLNAFRGNPDKSSPDTIKLEILTPFVSKREKIQGKTYWEGTYSLICFDTGYLVLPPMTIMFNNKTLEIPPSLLNVMLVPKSKNIDIYDIEENFAVLPEEKFDLIGNAKFLSLLFLLMGLLLGLIYFILPKGKKKETSEIPERKLSSQEKTRQALNSLMEKQMWRNNQEKEHFTELSLIIRNFLNEEYNNRFEGKTSFEIQLILKKEHFSYKQLNDLGLILNVSDMVKFAKSSVEEEGINTIYRKAIEFVNETIKE